MNKSVVKVCQQIPDDTSTMAGLANVPLFEGFWKRICWIYIYNNNISGWWFGVFFSCPYIGNIIIPTDFDIVQRVETTKQIYNNYLLNTDPSCVMFKIFTKPFIDHLGGFDRLSWRFDWFFS
jgi:hypothetical protein